jgi:hypothetical protein
MYAFLERDPAAGLTNRVPAWMRRSRGRPVFDGQCRPLRSGAGREDGVEARWTLERRLVNEGAIVGSRRAALEEVDEFGGLAGSSSPGLDTQLPYVISTLNLLVI